MFLLLTFSVSAVVQAATFHVNAANGNDANSGTLSKPFRTIQRALDALSPGDDVVIAAGGHASMRTKLGDSLMAFTLPGACCFN